MIGNQHPGQARGCGFGYQTPKAIDKSPPILIGAENWSAFDPSNNDVVHRPGCINSGSTWHGEKVANQPILVKHNGIDVPLNYFKLLHGLFAVDKYGVEQEQARVLLLFVKMNGGGFGRFQAGLDGEPQSVPGNELASVFLQRIKTGLDGFLGVMVTGGYIYIIGIRMIAVLQIDELIRTVVPTLQTSNASYYRCTSFIVNFNFNFFRHRMFPGR